MYTPTPTPTPTPTVESNESKTAKITFEWNESKNEWDVMLNGNQLSRKKQACLDDIASLYIFPNEYYDDAEPQGRTWFGRAPVIINDLDLSSENCVVGSTDNDLKIFINLNKENALKYLKRIHELLLKHYGAVLINKTNDPENEDWQYIYDYDNAMKTTQGIEDLYKDHGGDKQFNILYT